MNFFLVLFFFFKECKFFISKKGKKKCKIQKSPKNLANVKYFQHLSKIFNFLPKHKRHQCY